VALFTSVERIQEMGAFIPPNLNGVNGPETPRVTNRFVLPLDSCKLFWGAWEINIFGLE
jgi:hypothetical protein